MVQESVAALASQVTLISNQVLGTTVLHNFTLGLKGGTGHLVFINALQ